MGWGMTRMSVPDRYRFGRRNATAAAMHATTSMLASSSHLRRHAIPRRTSGVYFRPGNIDGSLYLPHQRCPHRETDPQGLPVHSTRQLNRQPDRPVVELIVIDQMLREEREATVDGE